MWKGDATVGRQQVNIPRRRLRRARWKFRAWLENPERALFFSNHLFGGIVGQTMHYYDSDDHIIAMNRHNEGRIFDPKENSKNTMARPVGM